MSLHRVEVLLAAGNKKEAVKELYDMIVTACEDRNFVWAEELHLKLMATDSMALTEIIGAAEVIEAAKSAAVDPGFNEQWQDLVESLTAEENNALYFALKEVSLEPGKAFVEQGKLNERLFFIVSGQANVVCQQGDRQVLFGQLGPGDIAGEDSFFGITICTTSVICQSPLKVKYLDRKGMEAWAESLPGIEEKLRSYALSHCSVDHSQAAKKLERRQEKRHHLEGNLTGQLLNLQGKNIGAPFRGKLDDVSAGGVCFYIRCSQQSMARMLLGRPVRLTITAGKGQLVVNGVIVSSKDHLRSDYTVHVKLTGDQDPLYTVLLEKLAARDAS